jgi:hypothetical protein
MFFAKVYSKDIEYAGEVTFKAETNMPGVSVEGISKSFKVLKADFSDDYKKLNKIEAEIDAETIKTGIDMRDHHMYEKVFFVLSGNEKPALLKMTMDKITCLAKSDDLECKGDASFTFGKKKFVHKLELKFNKLLKTEVIFNVSLKELNLEIPGYLGIELEDMVAIKMQASRK